MTPARPRFADHLRVLALLVATALGAIPFLLHLLVSPIATPIARRRRRRLLAGGGGGGAPPSASSDAPPTDPAPTTWAGKTVFVVAGEPSGDRLAARVVAALRRLAPTARVRGYAGPATAAAGAALDRSIVDHAVVGFFGVLSSLPYWWRL